MSEGGRRVEGGKEKFQCKEKNCRDKEERKFELVRTDSGEEGGRRERMRGWQMGEKYWLRLMDFKGQSSMLYNSAHNSRD